MGFPVHQVFVEAAPFNENHLRREEEGKFTVDRSVCTRLDSFATTVELGFFVGGLCRYSENNVNWAVKDKDTGITTINTKSKY